MKIEGIIKRIGKTETVNDNLTKRKLHLVVDGKYPQTLEFEFTNKNASALDSKAEGEKVSIEFDLRGREWKDPKNGETKVFNTLSGWKCDSLAPVNTETQTDPF